MFTTVCTPTLTWKRCRTRRGPCCSSSPNSSVDRTSASFMISPRPLMMFRSSYIFILAKPKHVGCSHGKKNAPLSNTFRCLLINNRAGPINSNLVARIFGEVQQAVRACELLIGSTSDGEIRVTVDQTQPNP